jgi:excisionase family DNA binding protein
MLDDLITVKEATARYKLSGGFIRRLVRQGRVRGRKLGTSWVLDPISLDKYIKSSRKKGRPAIDK